MRFSAVVLSLLFTLPLAAFHAGTTAVTYLKPPTNCLTPPKYTHASVCDAPNETPLGTFQLPPVGGSYTDPTFGATVKIISGPGSSHGYSTPSAFSASGRFAALSQNLMQVNIVETATGQVIYSRRPGSITADTIRWDAFDDNVYYWYQGSRLLRHRLQENQTDVVVDYLSDGHGFTRLTGGGTGDTSKDNWLSFWAPEQHAVCAVNLSIVKTYCADYLSPSVIARVGVARVDYTLMAKGSDSVSRKRYVLLMASPAMAVFSVDENTGVLAFEYRGGEHPRDMQGARGNQDGLCDAGESCMSAPHADTLEDGDGQQYLVQSVDTEVPCARKLATYRLNAGPLIALDTTSGGGRSTGLTVALCGGGPYELWVSNHIGCAKQAPYCAISTDNVNRDPTDLTSPVRRTAHLGEVMVMRGNLTEVQRLAQHRSVHFTDSYASKYWSTARAAISGNGKLVLWDSNFGRPYIGQYSVLTYTDTTPASTIPAANPPTFAETGPPPVPPTPPAPPTPPTPLSSGIILAGISLERPSRTGGFVSPYNSVALNSPAPAGGLVCLLSSGNAAVVTITPMVTVPAGAFKAPFTISGAAVASATLVPVTATCGSSSKTAALTLLPPSLSSVALEKPTRTGGFVSPYNNVVLGGAAPAGGLPCQLTSSNPTLTSVSPAITVPAGASKASFTISAAAVASATGVTITATCGLASKTAALTLLPPSLSSVALELSTRTGGFASPYNNVVLTGAAPAGGLACQLASSNPSLANVTPSVTVPAGTYKARFSISGAAVASATGVTITATCGLASKAAVLTLLPPSLSGVALELSTRTGGFVSPYNKVVLNGPAPAGGVACQLTSSNPAVASVTPMVTVPEGVNRASFTISATTVASPMSITITTTCGQGTKSAALTVLPRP